MVLSKNPIGVNRPTICGFRQGMKQSSISLDLELNIPALLDFAKTDQELFERFGIETQMINSKIRRPITDSEALMLDYIWQMMGLCCRLLQAIKIPSFDRGAILNFQIVDAGERRYRIACLFVAIEYHSPTWINQSIQYAHRILAKLHHPATTDSDIAKLLEDLHETFVENAKKQIVGGSSTISILRAAFLANVPISHLGQGVYQLGWGSKRRLSDRSTSDLDTAVGLKVSHNKHTTARILRKAGLPAPVHELVFSREAAIEAARRIGFPLVVKPADKERGEGVTINIEDIEGVGLAFDSASKLSVRILVERQVPGLCHRILVAGETSLYAVLRHPSAVVGDGLHTVKELITLENHREKRRAKHLRRKPYPDDELAERMLAQQNLNFESILLLGSLASLRPIESAEWDGYPQLVSNDIHPANVRVAIQAAKLLCLDVAGIDLISEDISKPWYENGAIINEVNFAPLIGSRYDYQKAAAAELIKRQFATGARIPVEIYIGDEQAWIAAKKSQSLHSEADRRAIISSHAATASIDSDLYLDDACQGLFARCGALLMNDEVDVLLLVVQTDEFLMTGLPIDSVDRVELINDNLFSVHGINLRAPADTMKLLMGLIEPYCHSTAISSSHIGKRCTIF
jgi:cyanophycin synthetase